MPMNKYYCFQQADFQSNILIRNDLWDSQSNSLRRVSCQRPGFYRRAHRVQTITPVHKPQEGIRVTCWQTVRERYTYWAEAFIVCEIIENTKIKRDGFEIHQIRTVRGALPTPDRSILLSRCATTSATHHQQPSRYHPTPNPAPRLVSMSFWWHKQNFRTYC